MQASRKDNTAFPLSSPYPLGDTCLTVPLRTSWHAKKALPKERLLSFNCPFPNGNGTSRLSPA